MKLTDENTWDTCTRHNLACDCREHKVAVLAKTTMDIAVELDECRNALPHHQHIKIDRMQSLIDRAYAALDALGIVIGAGDDDDHVHVHGCVCAQCLPAVADVAGEFADERN